MRAFLAGSPQLHGPTARRRSTAQHIGVASEIAAPWCPGLGPQRALGVRAPHAPSIAADPAPCPAASLAATHQQAPCPAPPARRRRRLLLRSVALPLLLLGSEDGVTIVNSLLSGETDDRMVARTRADEGGVRKRAQPARLPHTGMGPCSFTCPCFARSSHTRPARPPLPLTWRARTTPRSPLPRRPPPPPPLNAPPPPPRSVRLAHGQGLHQPQAVRRVR